MPETPGLSLEDVDTVVGWSIIRSARRAGRIVSAALSPYALTPVEFGVLAQLSAADGELTQAELARTVEVRPQSMAPVIDSLCQRELIHRAGARGRGRSGRLFLSDAGAELLSAAFPAVLGTNDAFNRGGSHPDDLNRILLGFLKTSQE